MKPYFDVISNLWLHRNNLFFLIQRFQNHLALMVLYQFFIHFVVPPAQVNYIRQIFFINGILDPMTGDVVNIVTLST